VAGDLYFPTNLRERGQFAGKCVPCMEFPANETADRRFVGIPMPAPPPP
jgi:hypothetical protein